MNIALILSGGTGVRLGAAIPKQYIEADGKPVIAYALEPFIECGKIDRIHIVADISYHQYIKEHVLNLGEKSLPQMFSGFSKPGENRQLSILNGLRDIRKYASDSDNVIIHDAARPFVKASTIIAIIDKLNEYEAVTPILNVKDTLYYYENGSFVKTADRSRLVAGQTPEGFKLGRYLEATESLLPDKILEVTGSLQTALDGHLSAAAVDGDEDNFKITTQKDLDKFMELVSV